MKRTALYFAFAALTVIAASCTEERLDTPKNEVKFNIASSSAFTKSGLNHGSVVDVQEISVSDKKFFLSTTVSENTVTPVDQVITKGNSVLVENDIFDAKKFGVDVVSGAGTVYGEAVLVDYEDFWHLQSSGEPQHWGSEVTGSATFWSYFNAQPSLVENGLSLTGVVNGKDVLFAKSTAEEGDNGSIDITFYHALAAINVVNGAGESVTVKNVTISNVVKSGDVTFTGGFGGFGWTNLSGEREDLASQTFDGNYFLIVPQALSGQGVTLTIEVTVDGSDYVLTHSFDSAEYSWTSGKLYTYTITSADGSVVIDAVESDNDSVSVANEGSSAVYVRAAVVANWVNTKGYVCAAWNPTDDPITFNTADSEWAVGADGYYYHKAPVFSFEETGSLIDSISKNSAKDGLSLSVSVAFQAVQYDSDKKAAESAWGSSAAAYLNTLN